MREIKFRGYDTHDGVRDIVTFTLDELLSGTDDYELVDPDSIAQLVGHDEGGKEVYEGDMLVNERDGTRFRAALNHIYTVKSYRLEAQS